MKLLLFIIFSLNFLYSQIIWEERFNYTNGTRNTLNFTSAGNNCDGDGAIGTAAGNYFGVFNNEFRCNDIEGLTCCSGGIGNNDNYWESADIDVSLYPNISISTTVRVVGNAECASCSSGGDKMEFFYKIDGGSYISYLLVCGKADGFITTECLEIPSGSILKIKALFGNQANDENYYFDDVVVKEIACDPMYINQGQNVPDEVPEVNLVLFVKYFDILGNELKEPTDFYIQLIQYEDHYKITRINIIR